MCPLRCACVAAGKCKATGVDNVGTVPAALTAYLAIQAFKPDIVISAGTAGGFRSRGAAIADVFVSTGMVNHDRRIPIPVSTLTPIPLVAASLACCVLLPAWMLAGCAAAQWCAVSLHTFNVAALALSVARQFARPCTSAADCKPVL